MYAIYVRQTDVRQKHRLMHQPYGDGSIIKTGYVNVTLMTFDKQSNGRRIEVEL